MVCSCALKGDACRKSDNHINFLLPMSSLNKAFLTTLFLCTAPAAQASVSVDFREGAPKDRFTITNSSECALNNVVVNIDLSNTDGKLIFDTTGAGAGVEVFQPFEVTKGAIKLISSETVTDGDTGLSLGIESLGSGESISFTIDVDDTLVKSELGNIRVSNSEIKGGAFSIQAGEGISASAVFGANSRAETAALTCSS